MTKALESMKKVITGQTGISVLGHPHTQADLAVGGAKAPPHSGVFAVIYNVLLVIKIK